MRMISVITVSLCLVGCTSWGALTEDDLVPETTIERVKSAKSQTTATAAQREEFGVLADLVGRTFRGEPTDASAGNIADIQLWLWSDDGEALIIKHRLEDGSYGGDSIVTKNSETGKLSYIYNTNAGFSTQGDFVLDDKGHWEAVEDVSGQSDITKVRSRGYIREDGALISSSEYLKNGEWVPGNSFVYHESLQDLPKLKTPVKP